MIVKYILKVKNPITKSNYIKSLNLEDNEDVNDYLLDYDEFIHVSKSENADSKKYKALKKNPSVSQLSIDYKNEAQKYIQRREDGQRFSDIQGAKLVLLEAPDNIKQEISTFFAESQGFLVQGWWKSALRDLQSKEPTPYVNQEMLDGIIGYIQNYIDESYV